MKKQKLVILGGGTAGNIFSHRLSKELPGEQWEITLVDKSPIHYYQPGFLFLPFSIYKPQDVVKSKVDLLHHGVQQIFSEIDKIVPSENKVLLKTGQKIDYDFLIIATGVDIAPDEVEGMSGSLWGKRIFDFYTFDGAVALSSALKNFNTGDLIVHITEMPIKCPVAPMEFAFLADAFFRDNGKRKDIRIHFVTPLSGAFTRPEASKVFGGFLAKKNIIIHTDFEISSVNNKEQKIIAWDGREIPFDLLVTVPTNMGSSAMERSGIGDELNLVPTNKNTLQALDIPNIFVAGDASDIPTSKAGSVAHFQTEIIIQNILDVINNRPMSASFDGHANCFIETGHDKAILIDFNYLEDPTVGKFPLPHLGPLSLLKETKMNHIGKLASKWLYWTRIIQGKEIPFVH